MLSVPFTNGDPPTRRRFEVGEKPCAVQPCAKGAKERGTPFSLFFASASSTGPVKGGHARRTERVSSSRSRE